MIREEAFSALADDLESEAEALTHAQSFAAENPDLQAHQVARLRVTEAVVTDETEWRHKHAAHLSTT